MPPARFALLILAVIAAGGVTVLVLSALPPTAALWLIPILMVAAIALRSLGWRR